AADKWPRKISGRGSKRRHSRRRQTPVRAAERCRTSLRQVVTLNRWPWHLPGPSCFWRFYLALENGAPTGFNPFQCERNDANAQFLAELIKVLGGKAEYS
ncbi:hypothetical protein, partial [Xanthomonas fragariae]|uniref:hypothetical protein n=1 Tax=Xanthomonas fragariae TaxID=48664 RepID=UPI003530746A